MYSRKRNVMWHYTFESDQATYKSKLTEKIQNLHKHSFRGNMVDAATKKALSGIPLMKTKAGPRDKEVGCDSQLVIGVA